MSHRELQNSEQLQVKANSQTGEQNLETRHTQDCALNIIRVDSDGKINGVESGRGHPLPNSSTEPLETQSDSEETDDSAVAENGSSNEIEELKMNHTHCPSLEAPNSKRKKCEKRSLPPLSSNVKGSTQLSVSQNPMGPHRCKACGKTFHYMYTLRTHVQTHAADKIHTCGICGKHLESPESLVQHLQSHTKRNKCDKCGKQFSNISRLKRHKRLHRPKGLNVMSLA